MDGIGKAPGRAARDFAARRDTPEFDEAEEAPIGPGDLEIEFVFEPEREKGRPHFRVD